MKTAPTLFFLILTLATKFAYAQKLTDRDGNSYSTVKFKNITWMASNLCVKHFRNGEPIPQAQSAEKWVEATNNQNPAWCYYEDELGLDKSIVLYNWYAVSDPRGLAPAGTHVPSYIEWSNLIKENGGISIVAKKIKSQTGWETPQDILLDDLNKFNAKPVGSRYVELDASFNWTDMFTEYGASKGKYTNFWTRTSLLNDIKSDYAHRIGLAFNYTDLINDKNGTMYSESVLNHKGNGFSVRCIVDAMP
jgi:uncharacterized protein (TIGR02145 family)